MDIKGAQPYLEVVTSSLPLYCQGSATLSRDRDFSSLPLYLQGNTALSRDPGCWYTVQVGSICGVGEHVEGGHMLAWLLGRVGEANSSHPVVGTAEVHRRHNESCNSANTTRTLVPIPRDQEEKRARQRLLSVQESLISSSSIACCICGVQTPR